MGKKEKGEKKISEVGKFEMRQRPRYSLNLPIEYYRVGSKRGHPGCAVDASEEGLSVYLPEKLETGQNLKLRLFFSSYPELDPIEIFAQIVWIDIPSKTGYRSGVKIVNISPKNKNKLEKILNLS